MDGSGNALVSPVSIIPSPNPKIYHSPGGIDENELCHDQIALISNMKSSQKSPSSRKRYMSPTISAASKAALPRKKILAERNGIPNVEEIFYAKPFNISPKMSSPRCSIGSPINVKPCSPAPSISDAKTSAKRLINGLNDFRPSSAEPADDLSLKPYDPVTNYLSPRPQFLRYNPNRRHRILLHSKNEVGGRGVELDAKRGLSFDSQKPAFEEVSGEDTRGSSVSCSDVDSGEEKDEKRSNENAEEDTRDSSVFSSEEDNEESSVFSSEEDPVKEEYEKIFNENAEKFHVHEKVEEEEEEIEVFEEDRSWSLKGVSKFLFVMICLVFSTHYISIMNSPRLSNNPEVVWDLKNQHHNHKYQFDMGLNFSEGAVEPTSLWGKTEIGLMKFDHGEINDGFEEEFVIRDANKSLFFITYELYDVEVEAQEVQTEDVGSKEEITDHLGVTYIEAEEVHEVQALEESVDKAFDQVEMFELEKAEEVFDELQPSEAEEMFENENNLGLNSGDEKMGTGDKIEPVEEVPDQVVEDNIERVKDIGNNDVDEPDSGKPESESGTLSPKSYSKDFVFPKVNLDSVQAAAIVVVPILFTILASLGIVYHLRQKKVRPEESSPVVEPLVEQPVLAENITPQPLIMEDEKSDGTKNLGSSSSLVREAQEEVAADFTHSHSQQSHAPLVELLGELVIGEVSSSRRSYSSMSVSHQSLKGSLGEAPEVFSHAKTTSLDLSAADSTTLDRSSTAEKKKRGKGAEGTPVRRSSKALPSPSPVRRSSRLRDRSAMSP